jgi:hypothetical protein
MERLKPHAQRSWPSPSAAPTSTRARDTRTAHAGLGVTHDAFAHLVDTLASLGVPLEMIEAIGAKLAPLRAQVVTV